MSDYTRDDMVIGLVCQAPVKLPGANDRVHQDVRVVWVSKDGSVVQGETVKPLNARHRWHPFRGYFACSVLWRPE